MNKPRIQALPFLGSLGLILMFSTASAFSQTRPGISAFVSVPEGCSYSDPVDTKDLYGFTRTQIQALALVSKGERGILYPQITTSPSSSTTRSFDVLREERIGDTCAGFILSPYTKSQNRDVATVARNLAAAYSELGKMTDERLGIEMQQKLQSNFGTPIKTRLSNMKIKREGILRNLNDTVTTALSLLVDQTQTDALGNPGRMVLTHDQRISLRDFLQSQFPSLLVDDKNGTQPTDDLDRLAARIRSFMMSSPSK